MNTFRSEAPRIPDRWPLPVLVVAGLVGPFEVTAGGRLYVLEIIVLIWLFVTLISGRLTVPRSRVVLYLLGLLWLGGLAVSDLVAGSELLNAGKAWSRTIVLLAMVYWGDRQLGGDWRRYLWFLGAWSAANIVKSYVAPSGFAQSEEASDVWKFGIGQYVTLLVLALVAAQPRRRVLGVLLITLLSVFHILMGSRALGGATFLAGAWLCAVLVVDGIDLGKRPFGGGQFSFSRLCVVLGFLVVSTLGLRGIYHWAVDNAITSYDMAEKVAEQEQHGAIQSILFARSGLFLSASLIPDSPLLGHGSWAEDPGIEGQMLEAAQWQGVDLFQSNRMVSEQGTLRSHSYIFDSWIEAGLAGAVFWGYCLFTFALALLALSGRAHVSAGNALLVFVISQQIWHILFSPFGFQARVVTMLALVGAAYAFAGLDGQRHCEDDDEVLPLANTGDSAQKVG